MITIHACSLPIQFYSWSNDVEGSQDQTVNLINIGGRQELVTAYSQQYLAANITVNPQTTFRI